jgi:hypothetical protein
VYYDAGWKLADIASTFRIRFFDASDPVLTLKIPIAQHGEQRIMREFELTLPWHTPHLLASCRPAKIDVERELPEEIGECLLVLGVHQVQRMGWVRNTRIVLDILSLGQIELDRLELPDGSVIFEVEIESADDAVHENLARIIRSYAPDAQPSRVSKFQRFREAVMASINPTDTAPSPISVG